ncbi:hypothetical protein F5884DRAFT_15102 [Xylogone sp. PMI_703]|nr:hypothetical protein F5884DRAFT_15102 [Xylogone sp. PMI_703]
MPLHSSLCLRASCVSQVLVGMSQGDCPTSFGDRQPTTARFIQPISGPSPPSLCPEQQTRSVTLPNPQSYCPVRWSGGRSVKLSATARTPEGKTVSTGDGRGFTFADHSRQPSCSDNGSWNIGYQIARHAGQSSLEAQGTVSVLNGMEPTSHTRCLFGWHITHCTVPHWSVKSRVLTAWENHGLLPINRVRRIRWFI